jgi:Phosphoribosylformylglycinamidine (FGAM) synthase
MTAKVYVTLKKAVLDPQGKAVERSLAQLGLRIGSLKHFLRRPARRPSPPARLALGLDRRRCWGGLYRQLA